MHQYEVAVLNLGREHAELRLNVRARVVICDKLGFGKLLPEERAPQKDMDKRKEKVEER